MQAFNIRIHKLYSRPTNLKNYHQVQKFDVLNILLYAISGIAIAVWLIGFFGMNIEFGIHILLIFAANLILLGIIQNQKINGRV